MAYSTTAKCLTYLEDDQERIKNLSISSKSYSNHNKLALYQCNPASGYPEFLMSTYKSACPIPGYNPDGRNLPAITTMEILSRPIDEAQNVLGIEEIRFISARNVRFWIKGGSFKIN